MAEKQAVEVPSDFEFLDPDRPDVGYIDDLSPERQEELAPQIETQKRLAASGEKLGPPWKIHIPGTDEVFEVGGSNGDEPAAA
jgi:hypothetical protein